MTRSTGSVPAVRERADRAEVLRTAVELATAAGTGPFGPPEPLTGGRNNRVFRLRGSVRDVLVKTFYRGADDARDRFAAEVAFSRYAWARAPAKVAEPIAADETTAVALFAFVGGRPLAAHEVGWDHLSAALDLVRALNVDRTTAEAATLPQASEARFSLTGHLELVAARVARLTGIEAADDVDAAADRFVASRLRPIWHALDVRVRAAAQSAGLDAERPLANEHRCLSPSDFGFHNALLTDAGTLVFHDFEYAGWDDPAKLVADFFAQPQVPVDRSYRERFADAVASALSLDEGARTRMDLLDPLFRFKWCCILLNEFLAGARDRRRFAGERADRRREQLAKAEALLARLEEAATP